MPAGPAYTLDEAARLLGVSRDPSAASREPLWHIAIAGTVATIAYVVLSALPHDAESLAVLAAFLFAAALSIVSVAYWRLLSALGNTGPWPLLSAGSNVIAGALLVAMVLVQVAVKDVADPPDESARAVYWGLDVAWDLYLAAGMLGFAVAFLRVPWFAWWSLPGVAIALAFLGLNVASVPEPPASAGLVDLGPVVGLWYFTLSIRSMFILRRAGHPSVS